MPKKVSITFTQHLQKFLLFCTSPLSPTRTCSHLTFSARTERRAHSGARSGKCDSSEGDSILIRWGSWVIRSGVWMCLGWVCCRRTESEEKWLVKRYMCSEKRWELSVLTSPLFTDPITNYSHGRFGIEIGACIQTGGPRAEPVAALSALRSHWLLISDCRRILHGCNRVQHDL